MRHHTFVHHAVFLALLGGLAGGCGSKSDANKNSEGSEETPSTPPGGTFGDKAGVKENSGKNLTINGQLAINLGLTQDGLQLAGPPAKGIVMFGLDY